MEFFWEIFRTYGFAKIVSNFILYFANSDILNFLFYNVKRFLLVKLPNNYEGLWLEGERDRFQHKPDRFLLTFSNAGFLDTILCLRWERSYVRNKH
jgi:hypothetical protein